MDQITARCPWEDTERWCGELSPIDTALMGVRRPNPAHGAAQALEEDSLHFAKPLRLKLHPAGKSGREGLSAGCHSGERGQGGGFQLCCRLPARVATLGGPILQGLSPQGAAGTGRAGRAAHTVPSHTGAVARQRTRTEDEGCS